MSLPTTHNLLKNYLNPVYVETGIWRGDSLKQAVDAGFNTIHGVDIDPACIEFCKNRFDLIRNPREEFTLHQGDSGTILADVIKDIRRPITFFLDSHAQLLEGEPEMKNPFPLMQELTHILRHAIRYELRHTIIIDDILHLTHPDVTGWSLSDIYQKVRCINNHYNFELLSNPVKRNLLVAS